jgi:hypothetical protein
MPVFLKYVNYIIYITFILFEVLLLFLGIKKVIVGEVSLGIIYFLTAVYLPVSYWLKNNPFNLHSIGGIVFVAITTPLGFHAVWQASPLSKPNSVKTDLSLLTQSITRKNCPFHRQPNAEKRNKHYKLNERLFHQCAIQSYQNELYLVVGFAKNQYFDPMVGTLESMHSDLFPSEKPQSCQDIAEEMEKLCPGNLNFYWQ